MAAPDPKSLKISPIDMVADELRPFAEASPELVLSNESLPLIRKMIEETQLEPLPEGMEERIIPGPPDSPDLRVLIYDPRPGESGKAAMLHMHGGGYVVGSPDLFAKRILEIATECDCLVVSVDYRLSPEAHYPAALEDNTAALFWLNANANDLGVDRSRIAIGGESAGAGHAAQLSFVARDLWLPIAYQLLIYPMLDDRTGGAVSVPEHIGHFVWNSAANQFGWTSYLGADPQAKEPPTGAVPARREDLAGLAPAWIGVGTADLFVGENIEYARRLIEAGVNVELLTLPGAYHGFEADAPESELARQFASSWQSAVRKALHSD